MYTVIWGSSTPAPPLTSTPPSSTHPSSLPPPATTQEPVALRTHEVQMRQYRTRSKTKGDRERAAEVAAAELVTRPPISKTRRKPGKRWGIPKTSSKPKKVRIGPLRIKGAGLGLFLLEDVEQGEWIARYSGDGLNVTRGNKANTGYRFKNDLVNADTFRWYLGKSSNWGDMWSQIEVSTYVWGFPRINQMIKNIYKHYPFVLFI